MNAPNPQQRVAAEAIKIPAPGQPAASNFIGAVIQSYQHLYRSLIFFGLLFAFLVIAFFIFLNYVGTNGELKAELKDNGGLVFELKKSGLFKTERKTTYATFLLPSNTVWYDTGLELDSNQECKLQISGTAHLAVHSLVTNAKEDKINPVPWTTADGNQFVNIGDTPEQLRAKKQLLLKPGDFIGNVLGFLVAEGETNDFPAYFAANRKALTSKIITINHEYSFPNNLGKKGKLYLSVNDILLNFDEEATSKIAYNSSQKKDWKENWDYVLLKKYKNLYFDDNIGCLLVQVEISEKKQP